LQKKNNMATGSKDMNLVSWTPSEGVDTSGIQSIGKNLTNLWNDYTGKGGVMAANQGNMELAKYEADRNTEFWNMQNSYNTPLAQMDRYRAAGLNPNLMYSQGNPGNAVSSPRYNAPNMMPTPRVDYVNMFNDFRLKNAQVDSVKAQIDNTRADTAIKLLNQPYYQNRNTISGVQAQYAPKMGQISLETAQKNFELTVQSIMNAMKTGTSLDIQNLNRESGLDNNLWGAPIRFIKYLIEQAAKVQKGKTLNNSEFQW